MPALEKDLELCSQLVWDTQYWGYPVARLNPAKLSPPTLSAAIAWAQEAGVRCLYFLADPSCAETLKLASDGAFRFVDMRIDLEKRDTFGYLNPAGIREAVYDDVPRLAAIARVAHTDSRFFKDTMFDRKKAACLYARWIERDFHENTILVAADQGVATPTGYVTCQKESDTIARIGLLAVSVDAQGRGIGRDLVRTAIRWSAQNGCRTVRVATQAGNVKALRLYESEGFLTRNVAAWFHRWFDKSA